MEDARLNLENINKKFDRKNTLDKVIKGIFLFIALLCASFVIFITVFIDYKRIVPFVQKYSDGVGGYQIQDFKAFFSAPRWVYDGTGGMIFLLLTTLYTTILSLLISVPTSIFTALFLVRILPKKLKMFFKTGVELLASIPSVIFGLFGMGVICPIIANLGVDTFGGKTIFSAVIILALMSIPTITMVSITSIEAVDKKLIDASIALGASKAQTNIKVVLKCAQSGIFAGIILGVGRALGEATAVQMVIGNNSLGSGFLNIFSSGNTLTSAMLSGINEASGFGYDVRFSLGLVLILVILFITALLNYIKNKMNQINKNEKKQIFAGLMNEIKQKYAFIKEYFYDKIRKD